MLNLVDLLKKQQELDILHGDDDDGVEEGKSNQYDESDENVDEEQALELERQRRLKEAEEMKEAQKRFVPSEAVKALAQDMAQLQDQGDEYTTKVEYQVKRREEYKQTCKAVRSEIERLKESLHELRKTGKSPDMLRSEIRQLEHRIYLASKKKSQSEKYCGSLRSEIDKHRLEIMFQDQRRLSLEEELRANKMKLAKMVEESNRAYTEREQNMQEIKRLEARHAQMRDEFELEWASLTRLMAEKEENYQKEFARMKLGSPMHTREMENTIVEQFRIDEARLKKAVIAGNWAMAKQRVQTRLFNEKVHTFEEAFGKVQTITGVSTLEELIDYMTAAEDKNFRAFNHLADVNNEIKELDSFILSLHSQIEDSQNQTTIFSAFKRQVVLELQQKFSGMEEETNDLEGTCETFTNQLDDFKPVIADLFKLVDCKMYNIQGSMELDNLSDSEMLQCLGMIEQRVNEILHMFSCVASVAREGAKELDAYQTFHTADLNLNTKLETIPRPPAIIGPTTPRKNVGITIQPPELKDQESDEEQEDDQYDVESGNLKPLFRENLDKNWIQNMKTNPSSNATQSAQHQMQHQPSNLTRIGTTRRG